MIRGQFRGKLGQVMTGGQWRADSDRGTVECRLRQGGSEGQAVAWDPQRAESDRGSDKGIAEGI